VQFTTPSKGLHVANRGLGTIEKITNAGDVQIRIDSGRDSVFNIRQHPHLDHGYAVMSRSSQGQTAERVLIHVDTEKSELLVNNRFAYVSVSRAQYDVQIYTNDSSELARDFEPRLDAAHRGQSQELEAIAQMIELGTAHQTTQAPEQDETHSIGHEMSM